KAYFSAMLTSSASSATLAELPDHHRSTADIKHIAKQGDDARKTTEMRGNFEELATVGVEFLVGNLNLVFLDDTGFDRDLTGFTIRELEPGGEIGRAHV